VGKIRKRKEKVARGGLGQKTNRDSGGTDVFKNLKKENLEKKKEAPPFEHEHSDSN